MQTSMSEVRWHFHEPCPPRRYRFSIGKPWQTRSTSSSRMHLLICRGSLRGRGWCEARPLRKIFCPGDTSSRTTQRAAYPSGTGHFKDIMLHAAFPSIPCTEAYAISRHERSVKPMDRPCHIHIWITSLAGDCLSVSRPEMAAHDGSFVGKTALPQTSHRSIIRARLSDPREK